MQAQDIQFLEDALNAFVDSSISRAAHCGDMIYKYRLPATQIKEGTGRQRLHDAVLDEVKDFFSSHSASVEFNDAAASFTVTIDLSRCQLTPAQAKGLTLAMSAFRAEHC